MKTNEIRVERNGALLHIKTYSKEFYVPTINVCRFRIGQTGSGYFWTIDIDLANKSTENVGQYEDYDTAFADLRELMDLIYGPNPGDVGTTSEIPLKT